MSWVYLDAHGRPGSLEELCHHHFISYALPLSGPLWDNWSRLRESGAGSAFRANTGHGVAIATEAGFGIGLLPRYTIELLPELEEIPLDVGPPLELWLMTDKDIGRTRKVRAAVTTLSICSSVGADVTSHRNVSLVHSGRIRTRRR